MTLQRLPGFKYSCDASSPAVAALCPWRSFRPPAHAQAAPKAWLLLECGSGQGFPLARQVLCLGSLSQVPRVPSASALAF